MTSGSDPGERTPDDDLFAEILGRLESLSRERRGEPSETAELSRVLERFHGEVARVADGGGLERAGLAELLERHWGTSVAPDVSLDAEPEGSSWPTDEWIARLAADAGVSGRYRFLGELGRGGMGVVLKVWDERLRRAQALKVSRRGEGSSARELTRFLEEAQVAAQLDHPGILPVYDLGLSDDGQLYFTMQLVRGRSLADVYALVHAGPGAHEEWTLARAVGVLSRVAEAMAYAHSKGVIHRDLKPANVMVGRFGEVYVMDWGLSRLTDRAALVDESADPDASDRITTARDETGTPGATPDLTRAGSVLGTPAYMAPEQATGEAALDRRADVYALGAMLYHLLAGQPPYSRSGDGAAEVYARVLAGPPAPLADAAPAAPAELAAIAEKAMRRDPAERYVDMQALDRDLRAWMEGRVVGAYEVGALAELRKWVARNRALAASMAAAVLALLVGALVSSGLFLKAEARTRDVLRLSAIQDHAELTERARALWPPHPERREDYRQWIADAEELLAKLPDLEEVLAELDARALPVDEAELDRLRRAHPRWEDRELVVRDLQQVEGVLEAAEAEDRELEGNERGAAEFRVEVLAHLAAIDAEIEATLPQPFAGTEDRWWHEQLEALVQDLHALGNPESGLLRGVHPELGWGVERRLAAADTLAGRSLEDPDARKRWSQAIASIGDAEDCPAYGGLALEPQIGLLPLGRNPRTRLWEFWHLLSGDEPEADPDGGWRVTEASGLVLVLIPGQTFTMGAQPFDPGEPRHDPASNPGEGPPHEITLAPYLLSKFEMTQAQWTRVSGSNPSVFVAGMPAVDTLVTALHPVESVSWNRAAEVLTWFGLALPTEAQWECAARAGTETPWWCGANAGDLNGAENLGDAAALRMGVTWPGTVSWLEDGWVVHAPVGSLRPNPWGLHDALGNVREWCADRLGNYEVLVRAGDGLRLRGPTEANRTSRGGSFMHPPSVARVSQRANDSPETSFVYIGIRPARALSR